LKNQIIKGTFILSAAGILTRMIGFYYRIFLSNTIGATGIGLYQMIFPMYGLCISFAVTGIQMAISKYVAAGYARKDYRGILQILKAGLSISLYLSIFISFVLSLFSGFIAEEIIGDVRCQHLLKLAAYAIPCCAIHGCIIGYFLGKSQTVIPAAAQLFEQISRVGVVYIIALLTAKEGEYLSPNAAMAGLFVGELVSTLICLCALGNEVYSIKRLLKNTDFSNTISQKKNTVITEINYHKKILSLSYPITLSRVITSVIMSFEAVLILYCLKKYGLGHEESIRIYGVLTGMAMPFIFFPSTITGAISAMILPSVSESESAGDYVKIAKTTTTVVKYCFSIGIFFATLFYIYGYGIGTTLFHNTDAGTFISILSWLCPFMYLGSTLSSILNGLGHTKITFGVNLSVAFSKVAFIWLLIPVYGIKGYLWGLLISEILSAFLLLFFVKKYTHFKYDIRDCIVLPCFTTVLCILPSIGIHYLLNCYFSSPLFTLCASICLAAGLFGLMLLKPNRMLS